MNPAPVAGFFFLEHITKKFATEITERTEVKKTRFFSVTSASSAP